MQDRLEDILARLESAVEGWSTDVSEAQRGLTEQLARARGQLGAGVAGVDPELANVIRGLVEECRDYMRASASRVTEVERTVAKLREAVKMLHEASTGKADTGMEALRNEVARLARQVDDRAVLDEKLERAIAVMARLESVAERTGASSSGLSEEACASALVSALRERDDALGEIARLRAEIESARRAGEGRTEAGASSAAADSAEGRRIAAEAYDQDGTRRRTGEILVHAGLLTIEQLQIALDAQAVTSHKRLGAILVEKGFADEERIARVLGAQLELPFCRLTDEAIDENAVRLISPRLAILHTCLPIRTEAEVLVLAMANPLDLVAIEDIEFASGHKARVVVATESDVEAALAKWYVPRGS